MANLAVDPVPPLLLFFSNLLINLRSTKSNLIPFCLMTLLFCDISTYFSHGKAVALQMLVFPSESPLLQSPLHLLAPRQYNPDKVVTLCPHTAFLNYAPRSGERIELIGLCFFGGCFLVGFVG